MRFRLLFEEITKLVISLDGALVWPVQKTVDNVERGNNDEITKPE
jgi:hypothetical protein